MEKKIHHELFPVPSYLTFSAVGLDISDQSIKYAGLRGSRNGLALSCFGMVAMPPGIVLTGKIQDKKRLAEILRGLKEKENLSFVRVSLPEEQIFLFDLHIPVMPFEEIRGTIELSLEEHIPIKASESIFDFTIYRVRGDGYDIKVSAVASSLVESYDEVLSAAGLISVSFELEVQSISRAIITKGDNRTFMIVDFGDTRTGISIVNKHMVLFTTTVDVGGRGLTESLQKTLNMSFSEAEHIKRTHGLARTSDTDEVFPVLLNSTSVLRDEISKYYIYWHTHKSDVPEEQFDIDEIILCGGNASLMGLVDYLNVSLSIRVTLANPWTNINSLKHYIPELHREEALSYATALGLALCAYDYD